MSPRRRNAKLAAQVSDDLVLVTPGSRAVWNERKRPLQGRRIERKSPRFLKLIHSAAAYLIVLALASGCATKVPEPVALGPCMDRYDHSLNNWCSSLLRVPQPRLDQYNSELERAERERSQREVEGGGAILCFPGRILTLCTR